MTRYLFALLRWWEATRPCDRVDLAGRDGRSAKDVRDLIREARAK